MHPRWFQSRKNSLVAIGTLILSLSIGLAHADDTGFLGRLFRFGNASPQPGSNSSSSTQRSAPSSGRGAGSTTNSGTAAPASPGSPSSLPTFGGLPQGPVTTPPTGATGPGQRVSPRPRVSPAVTTADPLLTRMALGRSNDGSQFGMFLQVFADGTVIDSEGVHRLRAGDLKPIVDLVQTGDLFRMRGHCGAPATDFIDYVHIVIYERRFGRLMAHSFSYSGNTQGCDQSIQNLHTTVENLQVKLSRQAGARQPAGEASSAPAPLSPSPAAESPDLGNPASSFGPSSRRPAAPDANPGGTVNVIPLTPGD
jgi:hypothetical protein